jgi:hypothetical protein
MPEQTKARFPWGQDTITVKGRDNGIQDITVHFDGETLNIVDFLNHSLKAKYATIYVRIMPKNEAKLKRGNIFDHNFLEAKITCNKIDISYYNEKIQKRGLPTRYSLDRLFVEFCYAKLLKDLAP